MTAIEEICRLANQSAFKLAATDTAYRNGMLLAMADAIDAAGERILAANAEDMRTAESNGRDKAFLDRLALNNKRIADMTAGIREIIALPDPVGEVVDRWTMPNGLDISKVRAPIGTIAIIYEARPNVTADAVALCVKSGNAVVLRGSKDAYCSNTAVYEVMREALSAHGYITDAVQMVAAKEREASAELLKQGKYIDVVIPRGGDGLKKYVIDNATMPVIASAGGNCHVYVEKTADLAMAQAVLFNAKLSRPSTCNACEQLLVDRAIAAKFLPSALKELADAGVEIRGCSETCAVYPAAMPAAEEDFKTEFHDYIIAVKVVEDVNEAINRINANGSKHSEAIMTTNEQAAEAFTKEVDAAAVYVNTSTRFTDGFQFGFGAEMGISTQKLHARGPLGLKELTSARYIVKGNGQLRK